MKPRRQRGDQPAAAIGKLADTTPGVRADFSCGGCYMTIYMINGEWLDPTGPEGDQRRCNFGERQGELHEPDALILTKPKRKKQMGTMTHEEYYKR